MAQQFHDQSISLSKENSIKSFRGSVSQQSETHQQNLAEECLEILNLDLKEKRFSQFQALDFNCFQTLSISNLPCFPHTEFEEEIVATKVLPMSPISQHQEPEDDSHRESQKTLRDGQLNKDEKRSPFMQPFQPPKKYEIKSIPEIVSQNSLTRKLRCSCKNSKCLKMYCECFRGNQFCNGDCGCKSCQNMPEQQYREIKINNILSEQPYRFADMNEYRGCHCNQNKCSKKYCKCYANGLKCGKYCECKNCLNGKKEKKTKKCKKMGSRQSNKKIYSIKL